MRQEKTNHPEQEPGKDGLSVLKKAAQFSTRWNRIIKLALVFLLFSIIFIVPVKWSDVLVSWGRQIGLSQEQAQSASLGRLVWKWMHSSKEQTTSEEEQEQVTQPVRKELSTTTAQSSLFSGVSRADKEAIQGVYFRPKQDPQETDLDKRLSKVFGVKTSKASSASKKEDAAQKELEIMWQKSEQAAQTKNLMDRASLAKQAVAGSEMPQE